MKNNPRPKPKQQKHKAPPRMLEQCWFFGFLVFWFFGFFGSLVFWFFGSLVLWFFGFLVLWVLLKYNPLHNTTKEPKNQRAQKTKKNKTTKKKTKNQKSKKPTKTKLFQHSPWSFGFLAFWFRSSGGSSRTRSEGSNSIPRKKHEHAGGSDVLKGTVCHAGGDHIHIYIYIYIYIYISIDI